MKKILYFFNNYKFDFITTITALVLYTATFKYAENQKMLLGISILITIALLTLIIFLRKIDKDFYFIPLSNRKSKDDWIGRGVFEYSKTHKCHCITDAESGYIFSKCLTWSDYTYSFDFKIIDRCVGVILRAANLSNYIMLQIVPKGVNPSIRINGGWYVRNYEDANLGFENSLTLDTWYKCVISCEKNSMNIKIYHKKNKLVDRDWQIPIGSVIFEFKEKEGDTPIKIPMPINLEYGTIGVRNWDSEKALVKNVLVKKY